jgi:pimeloyl-ACP methyl ester carboxylesterase
MAQDKPPSMLAQFGGQRPPAPAWFERAVAALPTRANIEVDGVKIETLAWGPIGAPGLLLLHGGMAHADWWSFIAPLFAADHRVVALSWSGMGGSGWRERYSIEGYVDEMLAAAQSGGLFVAKSKPVILAHSFGGFPTMAASRLQGDKFAGVIILDAPVLSPEQRAKRAEKRRDEKPPRDTLVYGSEAEALARFRFSPTQTCDNPFIVDWIARTSLRPAANPDGQMGVTWKFDPFMWHRLKRTDANTDLGGATCRVCMMWGGRSTLFTPETIAYVKRTAPAGSVFVEIPEAAHHVMADQPLALVSAVRVLLAQWQ